MAEAKLEGLFGGGNWWIWILIFLFVLFLVNGGGIFA
jgi:hypothetical protein